MTVLGVKTTSSSCRVATLSKERGAVIVHALASYPTFAAFRKEMRGKHIACAVREQEILIKRTQTPGTSLRVLKKTLPFQIETQFTLDPSRFVFHPFSYVSKKIYVAAAANHCIDKLISSYAPESITTEQSALLHFVYRFAREYHSLCIVYASKEEIIAVSVDKGNYFKSVSCAADNIDEAVGLVKACMPSRRELPFLFLGHATMRGRLKEALTQTNSQVVSLSLSEAHIDYALEIGIALEGLEELDLSIQFRKGSKSSRRAVRKWRRSVGALFASVALLTYATYTSFQCYYDVRAGSLEASVSQLVSQFPSLFSKRYEGSIIDVTKRMEDQTKSVRSIPRFVQQEVRFSELYSSVTRELGELKCRKVRYELDSYPTALRPTKKFAGTMAIDIDQADADAVKAFCERLAQNPLCNKGARLERDENGFTVTASFAF